MKEKQFDHIENKIRAAAENSEPDFDEQSWQKMEQLLDRENDRQRPLAWFIVPVMLCALIAGYFVFVKKTSSQNETSLAANKTENISSTEKIKNISDPENDVPTKNNAFVITDKNTTGPVATNINQVNLDEANVFKSPHNVGKMIKRKDDPLRKDGSVEASGKRYKTKGKTRMTIRSSAASEDDIETDVQPMEDVNKTIPGSTTASVITPEDTAATVQKKMVQVDSVSKNTASAETRDNKRSRVPSRFYFLASAGVEASSVKFLSTSGGATVGKYGLGVGYQLTKRLAVQTGVNVSRKKYIAGAGDYNTKAGSYWSMVEIKKVDANCLVYDIPVMLRYDVLQKNKFNLYTTAGISSFIMKKEDYQYDYIRDNTFYQRSWTYTGNKNLFSVVSVSAGVEAKMGNGFSLLAEPSVSVPISGVGDGKVKLYSMGLQVGLKYQPFKKKR